MGPTGAQPAAASEIVFTDDELAELKAVVRGGPPVRRAQAAPLGNGVGEVVPSQRPTVRQPAFSPLDVLVEAAFAREAGKVSWRAGQRGTASVEDDGIEPVASLDPEPRPREAPPPPPRLAHPDKATRPLPPLPPDALAASRAASSGPPRPPPEAFDSSPSRRPGPPATPAAASARSSVPSLPNITVPPLPLGDAARPRPGPPSIPPKAPSPSTGPTSAPALASSSPAEAPARRSEAAVVLAPPLPLPAVPPPLPAAALSTLPPPPLPSPAPPVSSAISPPAPSLPPPASVPLAAPRPSVPPLPPHLSAGGGVGSGPSSPSIEPRDPSSRDLRRGAPSLPPTVPALPGAETRRSPPGAAPPPAPAEARLRSVPAAPEVEEPESPPPRPLLVREGGARPSLEDAVFSSSAPPDHEVLRFTVPEPTTFRVIVGNFTPHLEGRAGNGAVRPAALPSRPAPSAARVEVTRGEIHAHPRPAPDAHDLESEEPMEAMESEELEELASGAASSVAAADTGDATSRPPAVPQPPRAPAPPGAPALVPEARGRRRRRTKPWFEELFDEDYLRTLPPVAPAQTEREARFLLDALRITGPAALLDIGCGVGRHAVELAARGHDVTGIDLSLPLLIRAADSARRAGVNVNFIHGDMRDMAFEGQFDAAFCWFSTFGYFDDETNRAVAAQIHRALKPAGRLLLDVTNRDFLLGEVPSRLWWQGDGCMVLEELDFNYYTSRLQNHRSVVFEDARQLELEVSIRAYSLHEVGKLLHAAGFRVLEVSGSPHTRGRFFGTPSRQILVVAEKK